MCQTFERNTFAFVSNLEHVCILIGQYIFTQITQFLPQRQFRRLVVKYNDVPRAGRCLIGIICRF